MIKSDNSKRLIILKRTIELKQYEIQLDLSDLDATIARKTELIAIFKKYLHDYEDAPGADTQGTVAQFLNRQFFLNQIAKVLDSESDIIKKMQQKHEALRQTYFDNDRKISVIDDCLQNIIDLERQDMEKRQDDAAIEAFKPTHFMDHLPSNKDE